MDKVNFSFRGIQDLCSIHYRDIIDRMTGQHLESQLIRTNHAKVMYDLPPTAIIKEVTIKVTSPNLKSAEYKLRITK